MSVGVPGAPSWTRRCSPLASRWSICLSQGRSVCTRDGGGASLTSQCPPSVPGPHDTRSPRLLEPLSAGTVYWTFLVFGDLGSCEEDWTGALYKVPQVGFVRGFLMMGFWSLLCCRVWAQRGPPPRPDLLLQPEAGHPQLQVTENTV